MISKKCKYALRATFYLAVHSKVSKKISGLGLAEGLKIPAPFLVKILQELAGKNLISSVKGPNGGFYLTEKNLNTPVIRIIEAIDGLNFFETCGIGLDVCSDEQPCPVHHSYAEVRNQLKDLFENKTILQIASDIEVEHLALVR